jgi:hypothetical protein
MSKTAQKPNYMISNDFIVIVHNGTPHTIYKSDARFAGVKKAIDTQKWKDLDVVLSTAKTLEKYSFGKVKVFEDTVTYNGQPAHASITNRIMEFLTNGNPFEHLVKFLDNVMLNPSKRSQEQLFAFLEKYKLPIDENGYFLAFKSVRTDFKDHHSGTVDNSVGKTVKVPRDQVSDDPHSACSFGLHLGAWEYVKGFGGDSKIILLRVHPKDVVSVPHDCSAQKIRVCEYKVVKVVGNKEDVVDFTSNHASDNVVTKDVVTDVLGGDKAYALYKSGIPEGKVLQSVVGGFIVKAGDSKFRAFFRKHGNWEVVNAEEALPAPATNKIGANKAYELYRQGVDVRSVVVGIVKADSDKKYNREFFRKHKDWSTI